jgi:DNA-binding transcriptional LysR family regulator
LAGRLKISVVSTGKYVMPYFLTDFIREHAGIELLMDVTHKSKVIESLQNNEVNFALVSVLPDQFAFEKLELLQNNRFLVGKRDLHMNSTDPKEVFKNLPLIFREKGSGTRQTMENFIQRNELTVLRKLELTSNEAVKQALLAGLGYSIMPLIGIKNELQSGDLKIIPVEGLPVRTTWSLIWMNGKKHSPVSIAFLRHLEKHKEEIVREKFSWYDQF